MEMTQVFDKLSGACVTVLKSSGGSDSAVETKKMTAEEFAVYATDQIGKAEGEKADPQASLSRILSLQTSLAVAKSAFLTSGLESFEIPVFKEGSHIVIDNDRFAALEKTVESLAAAVKAGGDDDAEAKAKAKAEEEAKAKAEAEAAAKGAESDEAKAKAEAEAKAKEEEEKKAKAEAAAKAAGESDEENDIWPMDMAKSATMDGADDETRGLYDWGRDPDHSAQQ